MAITLVGTTSANITAGAGNQTVNFAAGAASVGDVVYIVTLNEAFTGPAAPSGYTEIGSCQFDGVKLFRKVLVAADASVDVPRHATVATACQIAILRGIDTTTPEDAAVVEAEGGTGPANPASVTSVTDNAAVLAFAAAYQGEFTAAPSGYGDFDGSDVVNATAAFGWKILATAGAENPGAFTEAGTSGLWGAFTVAARPAAEAPASGNAKNMLLLGVG